MKVAHRTKLFHSETDSLHEGLEVQGLPLRGSSSAGAAPPLGGCLDGHGAGTSLLGCSEKQGGRELHTSGIRAPLLGLSRSSTDLSTSLVRGSQEL